jgi:probable selenium-dependent hydroxylase accessory protein YqeC
MADTVLIEADGAKHLPLKVPDINEPVILPESDIVIAVAGIDSLNRPLKEVCFRLERAMELLNCNAEHIVTGEDIAHILASDCGGRKCVGNRHYYAFINKCDNEYLKSEGNRIRDILKAESINTIIGEARRGVYE